MRRFASFLQTFVEFLLHITIAVPGSIALKLAITFSMWMGGVWHTWGGDHVWFSWTVWICGFVLGILTNSLLGQRSACLTWVVGAVWIALAAGMMAHSYPSEVVVAELFPTGGWKDFFNDWLPFAIFTIPAMNAFSYSIGAALGLALHKLRHGKKMATAEF
jgi:hypothetical protein